MTGASRGPRRRPPTETGCATEVATIIASVAGWDIHAHCGGPRAYKKDGTHPNLLVRFRMEGVALDAGGGREISLATSTFFLPE